MSRAFSRLHPALAQALEEKGWNATPVQENVIPDIMEGHDRLVIAPTGSGKTTSLYAGISELNNETNFLYNFIFNKHKFFLSSNERSSLTF